MMSSRVITNSYEPLGPLRQLTVSPQSQPLTGGAEWSGCSDRFKQNDATIRVGNSAFPSKLFMRLLA